MIEGLDLQPRVYGDPLQRGHDTEVREDEIQHRPYVSIYYGAEERKR